MRRVSLVRRDKQTLNGVDRTRQAVTFGASWDVGVRVPAGKSVTSDPVPFDLKAGEDVFVTYWVPEGQPTVYRPGASGTTAWTILGADQSTTVDWEGLGISRDPHAYVCRGAAGCDTGGPQGGESTKNYHSPNECDSDASRRGNL